MAIALPLELWRHICTSITVPAEDETYQISAHVDPEPYWVLVRSARKFSAWSDMKTILSKAAATAAISRSVNSALGGMITITLPNGNRHSEHGPSVVKIGSSAEWFYDGLRHRGAGLPAIVHADGEQHWYQHGICSREEPLPAVIYADGSQEWRKGRLHCDFYPAEVGADGTMRWTKNGSYHREHGLPAIEYGNGGRLWWQRNGLYRAAGLPETINSNGSQGWNDVCGL